MGWYWNRKSGTLVPTDRFKVVTAAVGDGEEEGFDVITAYPVAPWE